MTVPLALEKATLGVFADLVTALGFKPSVAAEKLLGGFDSHPLPFFILCDVSCLNLVFSGDVNSPGSPAC